MTFYIIFGIGIVVNFIWLKYLLEDHSWWAGIFIGLAAYLSWAGVLGIIVVLLYKKLKTTFLILLISFSTQAQRFQEYDNIRQTSITLHLEKQRVIRRNIIVFGSTGFVLGHFIARDASHDGSTHKPTQIVITSTLVGIGAAYLIMLIHNKRRRKPWSLN